MKKSVLILLLTVLFCSCDKMNDVGFIIDTAINIIIVDDALNDRLNPESPAYFGEEYVKGIELFHLREGERIPLYEAYRLSMGGILDDHSIFDSPVRPDKKTLLRQRRGGDNGSTTFARMLLYIQ